MKLLADCNLPLIDACFSPAFTIERFDSLDLKSHHLRDIDVLLTRSNVQLNSTLLAETPVQVVASPTSGCDHMAIDWLISSVITHYHAPGCNAISVAEYVIGCIALLEQDSKLPNSSVTAAVIGCGHIGNRVASVFDLLGYRVLCYDPPRAKADNDFQSVSLDTVQQADIISLHVPLTTEGEHPTYHLVNDDFLNQLADRCILINTSRGEVVSSEAMKKNLDRLCYIADVFENEPNIDTSLVKGAWLATPHIAGHAIQAKWRGIQMCQQQIFNHFSLPLPSFSPMKETSYPSIDAKHKQNDWVSLVLSLYNPRDDVLRVEDDATCLKTLFRSARQNYRIRHEYDAWRGISKDVHPAILSLIENASTS